MRIFIDESGTFVTPAADFAIGAVGALVITDSQLEIVERMYSQLRPRLAKDKGEVKGRLLDEADIRRVALLCRRAGLIYEVTAIDLSPGGNEAIERHRAEQCEGLTAQITDKHHPHVVATARELSRRLAELPIQLYAQSVATFDLVWTTFKHAATYHAEREPQALSRLQWIFDAKERDRATPGEEWWVRIVKPMLESRSVQDPFHVVEGADYSHLPSKESSVPDRLLNEHPSLQGASAHTIGQIFEEIDFSASVLTGLELVDVMTNAVRRSLTGKLKPRGWEVIPQTMIDRAESPYVRLLAFGNEARNVEEPMRSVLRRFGRGGRSMLAR